MIELSKVISYFEKIKDDKGILKIIKYIVNTQSIETIDEIIKYINSNYLSDFLLKACKTDRIEVIKYFIEYYQKNDKEVEWELMLSSVYKTGNLKVFIYIIKKNGDEYKINWDNELLKISRMNRELYRKYNKNIDIEIIEYITDNYYISENVMNTYKKYIK